VALASGGFSWRRKRGNAERLRPVAEDATSTTQLFHVRRRRPRPVVGPEPTAPPPRRAYEPMPDDATQPLVRYEWRTAAGDVLVVEAVWPGPKEGAQPGAPHVDLRSAGDCEAATVVRLESPGA
jgi:hypothetical protein